MSEESAGSVEEELNANDTADSQADNAGDEATQESPEGGSQPTALAGDGDPYARYRVYGEDKSVNWEESFKKVSEAHKNLHSKMGTRARPNSVDEYEFEVGEDVDQESVTRLLDTAWKLDLSNDQVKGLREFLNTESEGAAGRLNSRQSEYVTESLYSEWGNDYGTNLAAAQSAAKAFDLDMTNPDIGNNLDLIKVLARIGPSVGEDNVVTAKSSSSVMTDEQYAELMATTADGKVWSDPTHPSQSKENQEKIDAYFAAKDAAKRGG